MITIKQSSAITEVGYCVEPVTGREIEIEVMIFNEPIVIKDKDFTTIVRTTYTDDKTNHGLELFTFEFSIKQSTEAIKNISANPDKFKTKK